MAAERRCKLTQIVGTVPQAMRAEYKPMKFYVGYYAWDYAWDAVSHVQ
jgi:hypothetical protein